MKEEDIKNKSTETLKTQLKQLKTITGMLTGILIVLVAVSIYGLLTKENNTTFIALIAVAISCSAILPIQFGSMKKIKMELGLREGN
ncbi:MAG: hypothetical protein AAF348_13330 [Bacteroidota bacterium]